MYTNAQRIGKSIWSRAMTFATISLLISQGNAKTVSVDDPVVDEQVHYLDWMEFAQLSFKNVNDDQIVELKEGVPEFAQLSKPSPFSLNNIDGVYDESTGVEINDESIKQLQVMAEMIYKQYQQGSDEKESTQRKSARKHHRNLASSDNGYLEALEKIEPILKNIQKTQYELNQYTPSKKCNVNQESATQSTNYSGNAYPASNAFNSDGGSKFTHTNKGVGQWWEVQMTQEYWIDRVRILNRRNCCGSRLTGTKVMVGNQLCGSVSATGDGKWAEVKCSKSLQGNKVRLVTTQNTYLSIAGFEAFTGSALKQVSQDKFINDTNNSFEKLNDEASKNLEESYKFIKGALKVLYIKLNDLEADASKYSLKMEQAEEYSMIAFDVFVDGLQKAEKYLEMSQHILKESENKVNLIKNYSDEKLEQAQNNAQGNSQEYKQYKKKVRAITYASCNSVMVLSPASATACFATAAAIVETKLQEYRIDQQSKNIKQYQQMSDVAEQVLQTTKIVSRNVESTSNDLTAAIEMTETALNDGDFSFAKDAGSEDSGFGYLIDVVQYTMNL